MSHRRGARFKTQFQDRSGKGREKSPNRNDDNSPSPGRFLNLFASNGTTVTRTPSPQGERNKERGISQEEIDKRNARAERFREQLDLPQRRVVGNMMIPEHKKELPPNPIVDFLKVVDEYVKTQTLIKKVKESRQANISRLVAWDFFHEELYPITLESLYQNDKNGQRVDLGDEEEECIDEGSIQKVRTKGDEIPPTPRFLDVEMEDVHQFLTSPLLTSPAFRILDSMDVDETFPPSPSLTSQPFEIPYIPPLTDQLGKYRRPSITQRLARKESKGSITPVPPGLVDNKMFDNKGNVNYADVKVVQKDSRTSSMDVEYNSVTENNKDELSEPDELVIAKQDLKIPENDIKETEEDEQDEKEVEESQTNDNEDNVDNVPSPTILNPKLDLFNWVFGPAPLTRAQSGYREKIQRRKNKYKNPRFPDRRKSEKDRKKREYHARISENRNVKEVLDDIDRKEALCTRELNSEEKTYDAKNILDHNKISKLQDDYVIVKEELSRRSRIIDRHNKESLDRAKKDSKYKYSFSKVMRGAEKEIYNTPSLIPSS